MSSDSSFNVHNALYSVKYPSRAAQNSPEGRMRPEGRGLKTPGLTLKSLDMPISYYFYYWCTTRRTVRDNFNVKAWWRQNYSEYHKYMKRFGTLVLCTVVWNTTKPGQNYPTAVKYCIVNISRFKICFFIFSKSSDKSVYHIVELAMFYKRTKFYENSKNLCWENRNFIFYSTFFNCKDRSKESR